MAKMRTGSLYSYWHKRNNHFLSFPTMDKCLNEQSHFTVIQYDRLVPILLDTALRQFMEEDIG